MTMNKINKIFALLLVIVSIALLLTSCKVNGKVIGLSDYHYENSEKYSVGEGNISELVENIEINWMVGSVKILPHQLDTISFKEESEKELTEDTQIHYWLDQTTLHIKFCSCGKWDLSELQKKLTILVPDNQIFTNLKISSLSANVDIDGCSITQSVKISTLSGAVYADFEQSINEFNGDSTSGDFKISAPFISRADVETVSGKVDLSVQKEYELLDIETTSGEINLGLPENASFVLDLDTTSGEFNSALTYEKSLGKYVFGDGNKNYSISTVSGDVQIKNYTVD